MSAREYRQRRSLDDIARQALREMNLDLNDQLTVSTFYAKVRAAFEADKQQGSSKEGD